MGNSQICVTGMKEREKRARFRKCRNACPGAGFYGGSAKFCDEKRDRCVMFICVFCPHCMQSEECFFSETFPWPLSLSYYPNLLFHIPKVRK